MDIIDVSEKKVTDECVDPVIPLFSGETTINLVDARCLGVVFEEVQKQQNQEQVPQQEIQEGLGQINE